MSRFKLIVTDMDGTLLDAEHRLPPEFKSVVERLRTEACRWVIASGRQLANLKKRFDALDVPVDIIAENGALALCAEEVEPFYKDLTPTTHFTDILQCALSLSEATPVLCGATCAWVHDAYPSNFTEVSRYFENVAYWHTLEEIAQCEVCKVAVYHPNAATVLYPALAPLETAQTRVILSGPNWVDVQSASVDKRHALKALMERFSCALEDVVVFGDYFNDVGMLTCGVHGVAMGNALPEIRTLTPYHAPKNTENGVMAYLRQVGVLFD